MQITVHQAALIRIDGGRSVSMQPGERDAEQSARLAALLGDRVAGLEAAGVLSVTS